MTIEEALTLQPGDIIGSIKHEWGNRILLEFEIRGDSLYWKESHHTASMGHFPCSNPLSNIKIVSRTKKEITNNYEIY